MRVGVALTHVLLPCPYPSKFPLLLEAALAFMLKVLARKKQREVDVWSRSRLNPRILMLMLTSDASSRKNAASATRFHFFLSTREREGEERRPT